jgi:hypothetical protein
MARVNEVVVLDHPADITGPHSINCYLVEVQEKFKIVPDFVAALLLGELCKHD